MRLASRSRQGTKQVYLWSGKSERTKGQKQKRVQRPCSQVPIQVECARDRAHCSMHATKVHSAYLKLVICCVYSREGGVPSDVEHPVLKHLLQRLADFERRVGLQRRKTEADACVHKEASARCIANIGAQCPRKALSCNVTATSHTETRGH